MDKILIHFLHGLLIGIAIAAPVGPIGLLCIRRTLTGGMRIGIASGLGAACADTFYGVIAAFGLTWLSDLFFQYNSLLSLMSGACLICIGIAIFFNRSREPVQQEQGLPHGAFASTFFLTLTNPMTIIAFTAIFSAFGIFEEQTTRLTNILLVLGVFIGSIGWWLALSGSISLLRHKVNFEFLQWINRISGGIFASLGTGLILEAILF